jgi:hypothetical protein
MSRIRLPRAWLLFLITQAESRKAAFKKDFVEEV